MSSNHGGLPSISHAFNIARSGFHTCDALLANATQNMAGQTVDAFKRQYIVCYDLPYQDFGGVGVQSSDTGTITPTGLQVGMGVQPGATYRSFSQGSPIQTGNALDIMIDGDGFLPVQLPDGSLAYTRIGALQKSADGALVMPKTGYLVSPSITLPPNTIAVNINEQGEVHVEVPPGGSQQPAGQLQLATFTSPNGLKAIGDGMYLHTPASGTPTLASPGSSNTGTIKQGWREGSNVNAVEEITALIRTEKIHQMLTKATNAGSKMWGATNQMVNA